LFENEKTGPPDGCQQVMQQQMSARPVFMPRLLQPWQGFAKPLVAPHGDVARGFCCCHSWRMTRDLVNAHCATLPGAERSDPWGGGHDAWKVGGKLFAVVGALDGHGVSVKCTDAETADLLIEMGRAQRAPYFHRSWVRLPWGIVPEGELRERLDIAYRIIRAGLPKKVQAALGDWQGGGPA
jgi:predicted DNA-binding protein (MmcQ/YjbR family)